MGMKRKSDLPDPTNAVRMIANVRNWLLIGPLVERFRWLRQAASNHEILAQEAGGPPELMELRVRDHETMWIVPKRDSVSVIIAVNLEDEDDIALGRAFLQEFVDCNRQSHHYMPPCSFEDRDVPSDLRNNAPQKKPNVGFLTLTFSDQSVRGVSDARLYELAIPVMTFRNFFMYQMRCTECMISQRVRKRLETWQRKIKALRNDTKQ